jgi:hypothetical protein
MDAHRPRWGELFERGPAGHQAQLVAGRRTLLDRVIEWIFTAGLLRDVGHNRSLEFTEPVHRVLSQLDGAVYDMHMAAQSSNRWLVAVTEEHAVSVCRHAASDLERFRRSSHASASNALALEAASHAIHLAPVEQELVE